VILDSVPDGSKDSWLSRLDSAHENAQIAAHIVVKATPYSRRVVPHAVARNGFGLARTFNGGTANRMVYRQRPGSEPADCEESRPHLVLGIGRTLFVIPPQSELIDEVNDWLATFAILRCREGLIFLALSEGPD
jgi:hypothetical protein